MNLDEIFSKLRQIFKDPAKVFMLAFMLGIVFSIVVLLFCTNMYRDVSHVYAYFAQEMGNGNWSDGWVGRVPMLNILLSGVLARMGFDAFKATLFVSCLFYVLTLYPLRALLLRYLTPLQSAYGCLLYIMAPKIIRFSTSGLLESGRTFFLIAALLCYFLAAERKRVRDGILLGLSLAGLSVARGEGIGIAIALLLGFPVFSMLKDGKQWKSELFRTVRMTLLTVFVFLAGISPFCAVNYVKYGSFVTDLRLAESVHLRPHGPPAEIAIPRVQEKLTIGEHFSEVFGDMLRGSYEVYLLFGLLGIFLTFKGRKWGWDHTCIAGIILLHSAIYVCIGSSYRYHLYIIPLCMMFTVTGLSCLIDFLAAKISSLPQGRRNLLRAGAVLLCVFLLIGQMVNGLRNAVNDSHEEEIVMAEWLKDYQQKNKPGERLRVATRDFTAAIYYSGARSVWNYKLSEDAELRSAVNTFDLLIASPERKNILEYYPDLEPVPVPEGVEMLVYRHKQTTEEKE